MNKQTLKDAIDLMKSHSYVDLESIRAFSERIEKGAPYLRDEGATDHFCTFLIPYHAPTKEIFMGHHKKADMWIPPGGHIDKGETPEQTVRREWKEELGKELTDEKIVLFDISIIPIENPNLCCVRHFDFWQLVLCNRDNFNFDKREFYAARWISMPEATQLLTLRPQFSEVIQHLHKNSDDIIST